MKILGLSGGSNNGNSENLLKIALQSAKEASPEGTKIDLVRIPEISIPKHFQEEDVRFGRGVIEQNDQDVSVPDDRPFVLNLIMEADVILFSCPIYSRVIPGIVKHFQDKAMGPFQDTAHVRFQQKMQPQTNGGKNDLLFKPRVAGLIAVGGAIGTDWTPFGLPIMHQMLFSMGVKVVSQFQAHGCGLPGSALLNTSAIHQAQELATAVVSQAGKPEPEFLGDHNGTCPVCHLDMIVMKNANNIECATCGAKGKLEVTLEKSSQATIKAVFDEEGKKTSVLRESGKEIHLQEIIETAKALKPQLSSVDKEREELRALDDVWLAKPPTKEQ